MGTHTASNHYGSEGMGAVLPDPEDMGFVSPDPSGVTSASPDGVRTTPNHYGSKCVGLGHASNTRKGTSTP